MIKPAVIIIGPAYPLRGGLASFNERLAKAFNQQQIDTVIYTFSLQYPGFLFPGTTQYSTEAAPTDLKIFVRINSINPLNWLRIGRQIRKIKPSIVIVRYWLPFMGPCLGTIMRKIKKNRYTKIICIADNVIPHEKRFGDKPFTKYFVKPVDGFITMSEKVLHDLKKFTQTPAVQIVHPLYDNFGEAVSKEEAVQFLQLNPNKKTLLFFGFIRNYKGLDILFDAIKIIREKDPVFYETLQLLVAGEYYENAKMYTDKIKENGIGDQVIQKTNFIPDSEVRYYFCASDVVVQPYRNATQSGVTPLAYHYNKPMIVTNVGALPITVPHGKAGLVATPDAGSVAEAIREFFRFAPNHFLPGILEEKKKFSWNHLTDTIMELAK